LPDADEARCPHIETSQMAGNDATRSLTRLRPSPAHQILERLCRFSCFSVVAKKELEQIAEAAELIERNRTEVVDASFEAARYVFIVLSGIIKQVGCGVSSCW
jgi:hypothetical protein